MPTEDHGPVGGPSRPSSAPTDNPPESGRHFPFESSQPACPSAELGFCFACGGIVIDIHQKLICSVCHVICDTCCG